MSSLPTLRKLVKAAGSEASEKNAIVKHLAQAHRYRRMPSITSSRNGSKVIRTYLWKDTPVGTIALVSGPSIDGQVFLVEAVQGNVSSDDVDLYIPATRRNPAYVAFKRNSAVRRQARYTAASSQGQWGRDYNYLNNPEENIKIPLNKVSLSVPRSALDLPSVSADLERCRTEGILYDASGRTYQIFYTVIATKRNGTGPILASNLPRSFGPTPGYPKVFQARSLRRATERNKISSDCTRSGCTAGSCFLTLIPLSVRRLCGRGMGKEAPSRGCFMSWAGTVAPSRCSWLTVRPTHSMQTAQRSCGQTSGQTNALQPESGTLWCGW